MAQRRPLPPALALGPESPFTSLSPFRITLTARPKRGRRFSSRRAQTHDPVWIEKRTAAMAPRHPGRRSIADNVPVYKCIRALMEICGDIDFAIDDDALDAAGMRSVLGKPTITLHATDATIKSVLEAILSQVDLTYVVEKHRIKITTPEGAAT